jgi:hypothetical protein
MHSSAGEGDLRGDDVMFQIIRKTGVNPHEDKAKEA